ncbi:MAG: hypothetical protein UDY71_01630, partial [Slackia isoflavoniconvertens]|nr:hypothetical protein [Slackia isoflavoniconvertens]
IHSRPSANRTENDDRKNPRRATASHLCAQKRLDDFPFSIQAETVDNGKLAAPRGSIDAASYTPMPRRLAAAIRCLRAMNSRFHDGVECAIAAAKAFHNQALPSKQMP